MPRWWETFPEILLGAGEVLSYDLDRSMCIRLTLR